MKIHAQLLLALLTAISHAEAPAIDITQAQRAFDEAKALSLRDGGKLWGLPLYGPMLFVDPQSRRVVANQSDPQGFLQKEGGLYTGILPKDVGIANTAQAWSGIRWTMVMWPLPGNGESRGLLMMHECFHRIQPELPSGAGNGLPADHLATLEGRIWMQLEWRALGEALLTRGPKQVEAVRDALIFRALRQKLIPGAAASEQSLELNEGLAEYTGILAHAYSPSQAKADALADLRKTASQDSFARSFAYASGPSYGLLLDERSPGWRKHLGSASDLGDLLAKAFSLRLPQDPGKEADLRAARYGGTLLRSDETRNESGRAQRRSRLRALFVEGPILQLSASMHSNYTYNPNGAEPLEGLGTVFAEGTVSDEWGKLEAFDGYLVLSASGKVTGFGVPAPSDLTLRPLKGQGWSLALNPGWTLRPGPRKGDWVLSLDSREHEH